jgi:molybdopterin-containing oxidoreductase family membrane subunit
MQIPSYYNFLSASAFAVASVFFGFSLWTFFWAYSKRKPWKFYFSVDEIDKVVVKTFILVSIANLLIYILGFFIAWYSGVEYEAYAFTNRMTGLYWFVFWMNTFTYFLLPHLFWFIKIRTSIWFRIVTAFMILIVLNIERLVIFITSFHRDYIPSSWSIYDRNPYLTELLHMATFIAIISAVLVVKKLRSSKPKTSI